jgi:hypothetical protein
MINWTEEADVTTSYSETGDVTTAYGKDIVTYEGVHFDEDEDTVTYDSSEITYNGDIHVRYIPEGLGLYVAAEDFSWILTEDRLVRMVHSKTDYTEVGDVTTTYTEVGDA